MAPQRTGIKKGGSAPPPGERPLRGAGPVDARGPSPDRGRGCVRAPGEVRPAAAVILGPSGSRRGSEGGAAARCPRRLGAGRWPADRTGRVCGRATSSNIALPRRALTRPRPSGHLASPCEEERGWDLQHCAWLHDGRAKHRLGVGNAHTLDEMAPQRTGRKYGGKRLAPGRASAPRGWAGRCSRALPRSGAGKHAGARRGPSSRGCDPRPVGFAAGQRGRSGRSLPQEIGCRPVAG
jgi:hypothetical protein